MQAHRGLAPWQDPGIFWLTPLLWACRYRVFQAINATSGADPTVDVHCSEREYGGRHDDFSGMLSKMEHSEFCLVLPGDSQSTRRLSEIFLAGASELLSKPASAHSPL